jgi:hypothetical protein
MTRIAAYWSTFFLCNWRAKGLFGTAMDGVALIEGTYDAITL